MQLKVYSVFFNKDERESVYSEKNVQVNTLMPLNLAIFPYGCSILRNVGFIIIPLKIHLV